MLRTLLGPAVRFCFALRQSLLERYRRWRASLRLQINSRRLQVAQHVDRAVRRVLDRATTQIAQVPYLSHVRLKLARIFDWKVAIDRVRAAYVQRHGRKPRLLHPSRFTEKMQWRKLFDLNPVYAVLSDKLAVRGFIAERVGADVLVPLLWVGDDPDAIPFTTLDPPFIIKSTHASGHALKVRNRDDLDVPTARATFRQWLAQCFATISDEPGYRHVPRRLIIESLLLDPDGSPPLEHKMFVFAGRVRIIQTVVVDRDGNRRAACHDSNWTRLNWRTASPPFDEPLPRPARFTELVALAERLGESFDHMRVDLYDGHARILVGEMTVYSWSGLTRLIPDEADHILGSYWKLERPMRRAINALLWQRWEIRHPLGAPFRHRGMTRAELTDWLVAAETRYGGLVSNIPKRKASVHDPRTREEWSAVRMMGGDRMSPAHHDYAPKYAEYLEGLASDRERRITLVEVGILRGTGLAVWADLFPKARIIGLDLDTSYFDENMTALRSLDAFRNEPEIVEFDQLDATPAQFAALLRGDSIDVLIDDGSHRMEAIMRTLAAAMPHLAQRFVYFIEDNADVHTEISRTYPYLHVEACGELTVLTPGPLFPRAQRRNMGD